MMRMNWRVLLALILGVLTVTLVWACASNYSSSQSMLKDGEPNTAMSQNYSKDVERSNPMDFKRAANGLADAKTKFFAEESGGLQNHAMAQQTSPVDELWVIQRGPKGPVAQSDDQPGTGSLVVPNQDKDKVGQFVPVPLKHTEVKANVAGYIASVNVTQQFENPFAEKIEAVYVFPLPENAGINEFVMTIGERHIRGIIRERAEAEKIYQEAKQQGYVASLLTQERPNIFTQKVANIEPGKKIDVSITYYSPLAYEDGWFSFVFPMVVGPRYNPAGSTLGVGAVARGDGGASGQVTEVQYLAPAERSGHDISVDVTIDAGVPIAALACSSHKIVPKNLPGGAVEVTLADSDKIPNKDFVLKYKVAADKTQSAMMIHKDAGKNSGYFTLMLYPPADMASLPRKNVEMVFVVDTSGSMSGQPIEQAKAATKYGITHLQQGDTFQVVKFAGMASQMAAMPVEWTDANMLTAVNYVTAMEGEGGTEMLKGMNAALDFPHDPQRLRIVTFLTDGYIGNEVEILSAMQEKLQDSRVFSMGVGSSTNRYLMDGMARLGHGAVAYLGLQDDAAAVMKAYLDRTSHPAMTNIGVKFNGVKVTDVYPKRIPDLFVGKPVMITGRFEGNLDGAVEIGGLVGNQKQTLLLRADATKPVDHPALATIWARMKLADMYDQASGRAEEADALAKDVKGVALEYGLMSPYTAFLAVDSTAKTAGDHGTTVAVPVMMPEGVKYETTVREGGH